MQVSSKLQTPTQRGGDHLRSVTGALVAITGALTLLVSFSTSAAAVAPPSGPVLLHNESANYGSDCPGGTTAYWHFVVTPNNNTYTIESINLNLDGDAELELVAATIIPNGSQLDNVFVAVPDGYELSSIVQSGSYADVSPLPLPHNMHFNLSHLCAGTTVPETTVPETTVPETTVPETTVPETTVPETTVPETTVPESTTTTTIVDSGGPTTTIVDSAGPTTDPPVLPATGNSGSNPMVMFGSLLTLLGGVILLLARRTASLG